MSEHLGLIQTAAAVISMLATVGIFGIAVQLYRYVKEHNRVLFGEESVDGWNGIVPMVQRNRECVEKLKEEL